ncbi:Gpi1-domain-containing protein [Gonapodya prolifera JEL478]|uniref:Gpi1-domain-containing protein n=1 Tax=Gonapodya prolifera (strain JEL478) TaxID=1344416 RepID=A0A139AVX6_GONPJ|nr:Gpi1-domain-containing protein [Gonapodya prolifera JEL478]|eukprot:KXS20886.1 Gpi1-domain-containing protein [Gonapodya prolifera JEL478]
MMNGIINLFLPRNWREGRASPSSNGFIVGWRIFSENRTDPLCFVVATSVWDKSANELLRYIKSFEKSIDNSKAFYCGAPPDVIGLIGGSGVTEFQLRTPWLELSEFQHQPTLKRLHISANGHSSQMKLCQCVMYDRPNTRRLYSLSIQPLPLDISLRAARPQRDRSPSIGPGIAVASPTGPYGPSIDESKAKWKVRDTGDDLPTLMKKASGRCWVYTTQSARNTIKMEEATEESSKSQVKLAAALLSTSGAVHQFFQEVASFSDTKGNRSSYKSNLSLLESSARPRVSSVPRPSLWAPIGTAVFAYPTAILLMILVTFVDVTLALLNAKLPRLILGGVPFKGITTAGTQVDLRLHMITFWPRQFYNFWIKPSSTASGLVPSVALRAFERRQALYIEFHNQVWLVANDLIIGWALSSVLVNASDELASMIAASHQAIRTTLIWLMGYPAGLKLNTPLTNFLGDIFLRLLSLWEGATVPLLKNLPFIIKLIAWTGLFGATLPVALLSDLVALSTAHIYCFYLISTTLEGLFVTGVRSLLYVFQGLKYNTLRNRVERHSYDLDQLLLGTIALTLLVFLFPTIWVYYALAVLVALELILALLNHFPLFAILLRLKEPDRLPGGLSLDVMSKDEFEPRQSWFPLSHLEGDAMVIDSVVTECPMLYLRARNIPMSLLSICFAYGHLLHRLSQHYLSWDVLKALVLGQRIKPLFGLRYVMLPGRRPSLNESFATICQMLDVKFNSV